MAKKIRFYKCPECGSIIELVHDAGASLTCCGRPFEAIEPKTSGEGAESHVPSIRHRDGLLYVNIGEKMHPASSDHYIQFVILVTKQTIRRADLTADKAPAVIFSDKDHGDVYAYCSKHGLWKTSF